MDVGLTCDRYGEFTITHALSIFRWIGIESFEFSVSLHDELDSALPLLANAEVRLHLPNFGGHGYDFSSTTHAGAIFADIQTITSLCRSVQFRHAIFHPPEGEHTSERLLFKRLRQVPVPLLLENISTMPNKEFKRFYQQAKASLGAQLRGICLDVPHAVVGSCDWKDLYASFSPHVHEIHLSDCMQGKDMHLPFGMGILDLQEILKTLNQFGFSGTINYEIKPPLPSHIPLMLQNISHSLPYCDTLGRAVRLKTSLAAIIFSLNPVLRRKITGLLKKH